MEEEGDVMGAKKVFSLFPPWTYYIFAFDVPYTTTYREKREGVQ